MVIDPVCGMQVDMLAAEATYKYKGTTYYFCATGCKVAFEKDPERYLQSGQSAHEHHGHS